jgi:tetrahydromethanopterin S-methyltransferase subunit C
MVPLLRVLFGVLGAFWLALGALAVFGVVDFGLSAGARSLGLLMLGNGTALALAGWQTLRGRRVVDFLAVILVLANAVLSVTDEVGPLDLAYLLVSCTLLGLLVVGSARGVGKGRGGSE